MMHIQEDRSSTILQGIYVKRGVAIVKGKGAVVWDSDGNEYVRLRGGGRVPEISVTPIGM